MPAGSVSQRGAIPTLLSHASRRPNGGDADIPSRGLTAPEGRHVSKLVRRPERVSPGNSAPEEPTNPTRGVRYPKRGRTTLAGVGSQSVGDNGCRA
jgi:hypothetical protein